MSYQVHRFESAEAFVEGGKSQETLSDKLATWDEAIKIRDGLREANPDKYYNLVYFTSVKVYDVRHS